MSIASRSLSVTSLVSSASGSNPFSAWSTRLRCCVWLQLVAVGCSWLQLAAVGCSTATPPPPSARRHKRQVAGGFLQKRVSPSFMQTRGRDAWPDVAAAAPTARACLWLAEYDCQCVLNQGNCRLLCCCSTCPVAGKEKERKQKGGPRRRALRVLCNITPYECARTEISYLHIQLHQT